MSSATGTPTEVDVRTDGAGPGFAIEFVEVPPPRRRPGYSTAFWGMVTTIATESVLFIGLFATYFFLAASAPVWPPPRFGNPELSLVLPFSVVLLASSVPVVLAERAIGRGNVRALRGWLALAWVMGFVFLAHQAYEYRHLEFGWADHAYTSSFYVITGLHGAHVTVGLAFSLLVQLKAAMGRYNADRHDTVQVFGLYWHFVDAVWVFVLATVYLSPRL